MLFSSSNENNGIISKRAFHGLFLSFRCAPHPSDVRKKRLSLIFGFFCACNTPPCVPFPSPFPLFDSSRKTSALSGGGLSLSQGSLSMRSTPMSMRASSSSPSAAVRRASNAAGGGAAAATGRGSVRSMRPPPPPPLSPLPLTTPSSNPNARPHDRAGSNGIKFSETLARSVEAPAGALELE